MLGLKRKNSDEITKIVYENEIHRLIKERNEYMNKYETANKYKRQYKELVDDYRKKNSELERLREKTCRLNDKLRDILKKAKKNCC